MTKRIEDNKSISWPLPDSLFPRRREVPFGCLGAYWRGEESDIYLVFDDRGNLTCPRCGEGLRLQIRIKDDEDGEPPEQLFGTDDIMMTCGNSSCGWRQRLRDFIVEGLFVTSKGVFVTPDGEDTNG